MVAWAVWVILWALVAALVWLVFFAPKADQ